MSVVNKEMEGENMVDSKHIAHGIDRLIEDGAAADAVCDSLRKSDCGHADIFNQMIYAWRIFSPDFRLACSQENREFVYGLSRKLPEVMKKNSERLPNAYRTITERLPNDYRTPTEFNLRDN